jgi:hypothetical protein
VLALAMFFLSVSTVYTSSTPFFFSLNQLERFEKSLTCLLNEKHSFLSTLKYVREDLGVHSIRKGARSFLATRSTATPSFTAICICILWLLGNTKE